jgi:formamidopyrimidine-DNA glycosylase
MPELPEVETTVRGLAAVLDGERIASVAVHRADLRRPFPADLGQRLIGARVTGLSRRAKYGLIHTDRGDALIFHLGMSGRWRIDPATREAHDHLELETGSGRRLALNDPRRFGSVDLWPAADLSAYPSFVAIGPEPLGAGLTADHLHAAFAGRIAPIKNIYVCEALHRARIAPGRAAGQVSRRRLVDLVAAIRDVLGEAIAAGGSTLRDYAAPDGALGYFSKQFQVYGREGEGCTCGAIVRRRVDSGRSTFFCPACQRR